MPSPLSGSRVPRRVSPICPHRPHLSWRHRRRSTSSQLASTRGVQRGFFRSKPPPATGAYANLGPCVHETAHSSRAERQEEVINRGFNVTRRRGQPRFEATNEQRRAVEIWSGWGSRRRISAVSCGTAGNLPRSASRAKFCRYWMVLYSVERSRGCVHIRAGCGRRSSYRTR